MKLIAKLTTLLLLAVPSVFAGELKLEWTDPEEFRDADYYYHGGERSRELVLSDLERYFTKSAKKLFPEGAVLEMTVTELDLAGDFEPWHGRNMMDVRIIKDIHQARIEFDYKLMDADGNVIKEGTEVLRDRMIPNSMTARMIGNSESYPYIKSLVRDWMRKVAKE